MTITNDVYVVVVGAGVIGVILKRGIYKDVVLGHCKRPFVVARRLSRRSKAKMTVVLYIVYANGLVASIRCCCDGDSRVRCSGSRTGSYVATVGVAGASYIIRSGSGRRNKRCSYIYSGFGHRESPRISASFNFHLSASCGGYRNAAYRVACDWRNCKSNHSSGKRFIDVWYDSAIRCTVHSDSVHLQETGINRHLASIFRCESIRKSG